MTTDLHLRHTAPAHVDPLDHDHLQRTGRRRRLAVRAATGAGALALAAVTVAGIATLQRPTLDVTGTPNVAPTGNTAPALQDVEMATEGGDRDRFTVTNNPGETVATTDREPDEAVRAEWDSRSTVDVLATLTENLSRTPARPIALTASVAYVFDDSTADIVEYDGSETAADFPVLSVLDPTFDASVFEAIALVPTWTRDAAQRALDGLDQARWEFLGTGRNWQDRSVLVFRSPIDSGGPYAEVHVDPASGYTVGVVQTGLTRAGDTESEGTMTMAPVDLNQQIALAEEFATLTSRAVPDATVIDAFGGRTPTEVAGLLDRRLEQGAATSASDQLHVRIVSGLTVSDNPPTVWNHVDRVRGSRDGTTSTNAQLFAILDSNTSTPQLRAILPTILDPMLLAGRTYDGFTTDEPNEHFPPVDSGQLLANARAELDRGSTLGAIGVLDKIAESVVDDAGDLTKRGRTERLLPLLLEAGPDRARVITDLFDRTVVTIGFSTDEGEIIEFQFDPDTGLLSGTEVRLLTEVRDDGQSIFLHESLLIVDETTS